MPVTLAQAQVNTLNAVDFNVIDNLRRYSWPLDQIVFDDAVSPGTGGATLTYGYTRLTTAASANFRDYNTEFSPGQATRTRFTVDLKPLGGSFSVDRSLANLGAQTTNEVSFQLQQVLTSTRVRWQQELILGDTAVDAKGFDGLSKLLTGTSTEYYPGAAAANFADWTPATINTQALANQRLDEIDLFLSTIVPSHIGSGDQGVPGALPPGVKAILGNTRSIARFRSLARWAAIYESDKDDLGRQIEKYGDWVLIDMGDRADGGSPIIPIETRDTDLTAGTNNQTNLTDLFAVSFGLDALHGVSMAAKPLLQTWLPDFSIAGAVKSGEVEMGPSAIVVKNTKSCGVFRNVKVA
jgi:hypothetical protein